MVPEPAQILGHIHGGRVLDVATGAGGFIAILDDGLADYAEIIGIDTNEARGEAFGEAMKDRPNVRFERRDATATEFPDGSFDTVAAAHSLHHFTDPGAVLREMLRVVRPGGWLIVFEMYRDRQEPPQRTHVDLHHWWAAVDSRREITHRQTYTRRQLLDLVRALKLTDLQATDVTYPEDDPLDPDALAEIDGVIERYLGWADGDPSLVTRGTALRRRLHRVGIRGASSLAMVGRRPLT